MKRKILWLSHIAPFPPIGGVLQRSHNLLIHLAQHHHIDLLSFYQAKPLLTHFKTIPSGLEQAREALSSYCNHIEFLPIISDQQKFGQPRLAFKSLFSKRGYTINWLTSDAFTQSLKKIANNYDLVHFDTISLAPFCNLLNCKTALNHHNIESQMMQRRAQQEPNLLKKAYFCQEGIKLERYERKIVPEFDLHVTCSDLDSERLRDINPLANCISVPNGVNPEFMNADYSQMGSADTLLFAGRLSAYANQAAARRLVDEIWPALTAEKSDFKLIIAGSDPGSYLDAAADIDKRITVTGFIQDIKPYFKSAGIFVCPINDGGGTRLKILDAMAMGKAVIADPISCEGLPVRDGENVLLAKTTADYVAAILELSQNPDRLRQLAVAGRALVEQHFGYNQIGANYAAKLETLIANQR